MAAKAKRATVSGVHGQVDVSNTVDVNKDETCAITIYQDKPDEDGGYQIITMTVHQARVIAQFINRNTR